MKPSTHDTLVSLFDRIHKLKVRCEPTDISVSLNLNNIVWRFEDLKSKWRKSSAKERRNIKRVASYRLPIDKKRVVQLRG